MNIKIILTGLIREAQIECSEKAYRKEEPIYIYIYVCVYIYVSMYVYESAFGSLSGFLKCPLVRGD
jgi:hypothetical protein